MINFRELSLELGPYTDNGRKWSKCRMGTYIYQATFRIRPS